MPSKQTPRRRSSRTKASSAVVEPSENSPSPAVVSKPRRQKKPEKKSKRNNNYTRPGVEAAARLASLRPASDHVGEWERASSRYATAIRTKGGAKLEKLDERREELATGWNRTEKKSAHSRTLSKEELLGIVIPWKFAKGKPRNALKPLLESNGEAAVIAASRRAFEEADAIPHDDDARGRNDGRISAAIKGLCELKGVGPATASAILCLYLPDAFAFMDDEVIECLYDGKRGYTLKIYAAVNDRCGEIAAELNEAPTGGGNEVDGEAGSSSEKKEKWTSCRVGKALWTVATMSAASDEDGLSFVFEGEGTQKRQTSDPSKGKEGKKQPASRKRARKG